MTDNTTMSEFDTSDFFLSSGSNTLTDFTRMVSDAFGKNRETRQRQKIRQELVRDYLEYENTKSAPVKSFWSRLFHIG